MQWSLRCQINRFDRNVRAFTASYEFTYIAFAAHDSCDTFSLEFDVHCVCFRFSEWMNSELNRTRQLFLFLFASIWFFRQIFVSVCILLSSICLCAATRFREFHLYATSLCESLRIFRVCQFESRKMRNETEKKYFFFIHFISSTLSQSFTPHIARSLSLSFSIALKRCEVHVVMYLPNPNQLSCDNFSCIVHTDNASSIIFFLSF